MPPVTYVEIIVKREAPLPLSAYRLSHTWDRVARSSCYDIYQAIMDDEPAVDALEPLIEAMKSGAVIDFDHLTHYIKEVIIV